MIKKFLNFNEAAERLNQTPQGLRQGFETGLASKLPAYLNFAPTSSIACVYGGEFIHTPDSLPYIQLENGKKISLFPFIEDEKRFYDYKLSELGDEYSDIDRAILPKRETDCSATVRLSGFFRVAPDELKSFARNGIYRPERAQKFKLPWFYRLLDKLMGTELPDSRFEYGMQVAPISWWSNEAAFPKNERGDPSIMFGLIATSRSGSRREISFFDLMFHIEDIDALNVNLNYKLTNTKTSAKPDSELDKRERNTLLCIIGALADEADISLSEPYKAAGQLETLLSQKGVKASSRTIGDHLKCVSEALDARKS